MDKEDKMRKTITKVVPLKQKIAGWQSMNTVSIGGISHTNGEGDTEHWIGDPVKGGVCEVSLTENGVLFNWKGGSGNSTEKYFCKMYISLQIPVQLLLLLSSFLTSFRRCIF